MNRPRSLLVLAVSALAIALSPLSAFAAERLGRTVEKPRAGYSVRILDGWQEIPIQPGEEQLVGRFMPERETIRGAQFDVYRFDLRPTVTIVHSGERKPGDAPIEALDLESMIRSRQAEPGEAKPLDGGDGRKGEYFEVESPWGMTLAVRFRNSRHEYALVYRALGRDYEKDYRSVFLKSARTFRLLAIESDAGLGEVAGMTVRERLRRAKHARIEGIPGWYATDTENYVILSNSEDKALVRKIASQIEKVRVLYEELFPPVREVTALSVVRVCNTQQEYHKYGGPPGTGGYWNDDPAVEELVFYNRAPNQSKRQAKKNSLSVLYHEAFHQYIYYAIGEVAPHSWYNEGHGDYFAGAVPVGDKYSIGPFEWRVPVVRRLVAEEKLVPLKKFVYFSQAEYYRNARANYAQGWAFIYFLRKGTKNPEWKRIPDVYFSYLKAHLSPEDTTTPKVPRPGDAPDAPPPPSPAPPEEPKGPGGEGPLPPPPEGGTPPADGEDDGEELPPPPDPKIAESLEKQKVLKDAVDKAFEGVDWDALEREFRAFLKRI